MPTKIELEYRQVIDKRAGYGIAFRYLQGERIGALYAVSLICKHCEVQVVPDQAQRSERRCQALPLHGQPNRPYVK